VFKISPRQIKSNAFSHIFQIPEAIVELYEYASGIKIDPREIKINLLENGILGNTIYNDASFIKKDGTLVCLFEHQSSDSANMHLRMLKYYLEVLEEYLKEKGISLLNSNYVNPPKVEFYVPYNGKAKFNRELENLDLGGFSVKVKFVDIKLEALKDISEDKKNLKGYAILIHENEENRRKGMSPEESLVTALKTTKEKGYLNNIISDNEIKSLAKTWSRDELRFLQGEEAGILKGIAQEKLSLAKNLLSENMSNELIAKVTGLGLEEIQKLQEEM